MLILRYAGCGNILNILKNVKKMYYKNIKYSLLYNIHNILKTIYKTFISNI